MLKVSQVTDINKRYLEKADTESTINVIKNKLDVCIIC